MKFELPALPYAYDALEPVIDSETMKFHHDKHHQAYVSNLNKALEAAPELPFTCAGSLLKNLNEVPEEIRTAVRNNGGGHLNHTLFWESMRPGGSNQPGGALAQAIRNAFGSFENMKEKFEAAGLARFGSGWVWLVLDEKGELKILSTPNQDNPLSDGKRPLLGNDVWEHAYYLRYQNRRADYLKAWWSLVNWDIVGERYEHFLGNRESVCKHGA